MSQGNVHNLSHTLSGHWLLYQWLLYLRLIMEGFRIMLIGGHLRQKINWKINLINWDKKLTTTYAQRINLRHCKKTWMEDLELIGTNINHKGLQRTANEYAEERRIYKDLISKNNNNIDILNSASRMLQCWSY